MHIQFQQLACHAGSTQVLVRGNCHWSINMPESESAAKLTDNVATEMIIKKLFEMELFNYSQMASKAAITLPSGSQSGALPPPPRPAAQVVHPICEAPEPQVKTKRKMDDLDNFDTDEADNI